MTQQHYFLTNKNCFLKTKRNPLLDCTRSVVNSEEDEIHKKKIRLQYRSTDYAFSFIPIILKRILIDAKQVSKYYEIDYKINEPSSKKIPSKKERYILSHGLEFKHQEYLDVADFFIHANILMDQIGKLVSLFLGLSNTSRSFSKHKSSFLKNDFGNKKYKRYILNTNWYERLLKNPRDDLIVHPYPLLWTDAAVGGILVSVSRISLDKKSLAKQLDKLKLKYQGKITSLQSEISYQIILDLLLEKINELEKDDQHRITIIFKNWGRILPPLDKVSKHIFDYISFVSKNFN